MSETHEKATPPVAAGFEWAVTPVGPVLQSTALRPIAQATLSRKGLLTDAEAARELEILRAIAGDIENRHDEAAGGSWRSPDRGCSAPAERCG